MRKEVLIYGQFDSYSASLFIEEINEALEKDENAEITVRLNTPGGDVEYAWGAVAKFAELKNKKSVKVDGKAQSMGLYFCCYTDEVEALDVSEFLIHRAAYPSWVESDPDYFTADRRESLDRMNKKLRAAFEAKVDVKLFEEITKVKLNDIFSMEGRLDVRLTAVQAKKIGLIKSYTTITPKKKAEIESLLLDISARNNGLKVAAKTEDQPQKKINMITLQELKSENPALYAEVLAIGEKEGAKKEKQRIEAWAHFMEIDPKAVKEGIASGEPMSQLQIIELSEKKFSKKGVEDLEDDSKKDPLKTGEVVMKVTKEQKELLDFKSEVLGKSAVLTEKK